MSRIVIDARESGTSTGRYIDKLIEHLHKLKPAEDFVILTKKRRLEFMKGIAPSFKVVECNMKEFSFAEQFELLKQISQLHPDLVHFGKVEQPILYVGKSVTTMHDLTTTWEKNPSKDPLVHWIKQQVYKLVNQIAARKSKVIITPTEFVKNDVVRFTGVSPDKITVTYEAADKIKEKPVPIKGLVGKQFLMYVGRPMPHKNLERLIDAFMQLQQKYPDLRLVLAGKKDFNYSVIEAQAKRQKVQNLLFTDFISEGQLRWLYENTRAYIVPSISEGFGLPGLEAMLHGAPVLSSNATCLPEVYGNGAHYFDPFDVAAIARAIEDVLRDKKLSDRLTSAGAKQAKKYSWERMAKQTLEVYKASLQ